MGLERPPLVGTHAEGGRERVPPSPWKRGDSLERRPPVGYDSSICHCFYGLLYLAQKRGYHIAYQSVGLQCPAGVLSQGAACKEAAAHPSVRRLSRTPRRPARGRGRGNKSERRSAATVIATGERPYRSLRRALHSVTVVPVLPEVPDGATGGGLRGHSTGLVWPRKRPEKSRHWADRGTGPCSGRRPPVIHD